MNTYKEGENQTQTRGRRVGEIKHNHIVINKAIERQLWKTMTEEEERDLVFKVCTGLKSNFITESKMTIATIILTSIVDVDQDVQY